MFQSSIRRTSTEKVGVGRGHGAHYSKHPKCQSKICRTPKDGVTLYEINYREKSMTLNLCKSCRSLAERKQFCPECLELYDSDTAEEFFECDKCKCWYHMKCDPRLKVEHLKELENMTYFCMYCEKEEKKMIQRAGGSPHKDKGPKKFKGKEKESIPSASQVVALQNLVPGLDGVSSRYQKKRSDEAFYSRNYKCIEKLVEEGNIRPICHSR